MMKKITLASLFALTTLPALAQSDGGFLDPAAQQAQNKGGFSGENATLTAAREVKNLKYSGKRGEKPQRWPVYHARRTHR
jgi:uncharacterized protein YdeI (BOF family)